MIRIVDHEVPFEERTFFARAVAALKQENPDQVQIVHSTEYDLFLPLPPQFDRAVMDRFACYVPGWEMPKNSTEYLTHNYGLITDFLAEAFHYQLKHSNRYEEVSQRIRLGSSVKGAMRKASRKWLAPFSRYCTRRMGLVTGSSRSTSNTR